LEQKDIWRREAFQFDRKRPLKSLSKAKENASHEKAEKAFLRGLERKGNMVPLFPFLRKGWKYH